MTIVISFIKKYLITFALINWSLLAISKLVLVMCDRIVTATRDASIANVSIFVQYQELYSLFYGRKC